MKINIRNLLVKTSLLLLVLVCTMRFYIDNLIFSNFSIFLLMGAILLLVLVLLKERYIKISKSIILISILLILPSFYKNAYIEDHIYSNFLYYILIIIYALVLFPCKLNNRDINYVLSLFGLFAIVTSLVTWISLFNPSFYINNIVTLLPEYSREDIILNFTKLNCRPGLTSHYSRNAFFILLGILTFVYKFLNNHRKRDFLIIIFLFLTMLLVGKRAHLIFLIVSMIITYFIYNKVAVKTIIKFIIICLVCLLCCVLAIKFIPGVDNAYNRIFNNTSEDISSGRFDMYKDAYELYKNNKSIGIGWGQYAKSTNYTHPGLHNDYLQLLFENGILGLIIVIGCNIYILSKAIKYVQIYKNALSIIILVYNIFYLIYSLTGLPHYDVDTNIYYYLLASILLYNINITKKRENIKEINY